MTAFYISKDSHVGFFQLEESTEINLHVHIDCKEVVPLGRGPVPVRGTVGHRGGCRRKEVLFWKSAGFSPSPQPHS